MAISLLEALFGMHVDTSGLESGLKKAEDLAEQATKQIAGNFELMSAGIATAIAGTVIIALEKAIKTTAEFGLEMEHLGNRMGMTAQQAATLTGVMERYGVSTGVAARSMQIMAMEMKQTGDSLDPLHTRLGQVLGTLRDTNGNLLSMSQVLDLAREKVSSAANATQQLQLAQQIFGTRMGGQLLPMLKLSNEEWEKQKSSVEDALGPVDEASEAAISYKEATAALDQELRGLQITIGSKLLPVLTKLIEGMETAGTWIKRFASEAKTADQIFDEFSAKMVKAGEARDALASKPFSLSGLSPEDFEKFSKATKQLTQEMDQADKLGLVTTEERTAAIKEQLDVIQEGIRREQELQSGTKGGLSVQARLESEDRILKFKIEGAQAVARQAEEQYRNEELQAKALGLINQQSEIEFLEKRLADNRIVGDERLKLEADLFEKRKKFEEDLVTTSVKMGAISVDQEIAYRRQKATELLGRGDVLGAANEVAKTKELAVKQFDQQVEFVKKLHTISIQSEIDFQRQKLEVVKGNAEEEMQVISKIADLDKDLYNRRLQFALTYTQNTIDAYRKMQQATGQGGGDISGSKESLTFAQAANEAERARFQNAKDISDIAAHGGTEEARNQAIQQAQAGVKQFDDMVALGKELTDGMKEQKDAFLDLLKAASGGEEVRAPGGPSTTVGSITSSIEGLATQGLNRSTAIPQLDTSFTDLATRLRDVLNTNVSNLVNFGQAVGDAAKKISAITGVPLNPGAAGPGGGITSAGSPSTGIAPPLGGGTATVAPPTVGPGGTPTTPTQQTGINGGGGNDAIVAQLKSLNDRIEALNDSTKGASLSTAGAIEAAIQRLQAQRNQLAVTVSVDPNSGDILTTQKLMDQL